MTVEVTLITVTKETNKSGFKQATEHKLNVICEKKSVKRSEFYNCLKSNIIPKFAFEMYADEYELTKQVDNDGTHYASKLIYEDEEYEILRTYTDDDFRIELITK